MSKKASILIVSGNLSSHNARDCLKSLKANTPPELVREEIEELQTAGNELPAATTRPMREPAGV